MPESHGQRARLDLAGTVLATLGPAGGNTRPVLGPNGVAVLEHVLHVLDGHPADLPAKLEAFAMLNTITAVFVQHELAGGSAAQQRSLAYLQHVLAAGERPRLSQLLAPAQAGTASPADPYPRILARVLTGLLGPA